MDHVAIDLGGQKSQVCIRRPDGSIVEEKKVLTRRMPKLMEGWPSSRVILETCSEAFHIADAAKDLGHDVRVVPATLARELKSISGTREALVETRTKLINNVRGWLRTQLWRIRKGATSTFAARVRGFAAAQDKPLPRHIESELLVIEAVQEQVKAADRQVSRIAGEHPVCHRLMTVPGVGPVTAVRFVAALDDPSRFPNAHALQSYLGLTPGEHSSSTRERRTGITKAGPAQLRRVLVQAAWSAFRSRPSDPTVVWAAQIAARRGRFVAIVALARKISGILLAMWRDGTSYRASHAAQRCTLAR